MQAEPHDRNADLAIQMRGGTAGRANPATDPSPPEPAAPHPSRCLE
jgi:hypothetical protein